MERELTEKQETLLYNITVYKSWTEAAKQAGYSDQSARNIKSIVKKSPGVMSRIKSDYENDTSLLLPELSQLNKKVVRLCSEDITQVPKYQKAIDNIQRTAGVLQETPAIQNTYIKIDSIQAIISDKHKALQR